MPSTSVTTASRLAELPGGTAGWVTERSNPDNAASGSPRCSATSGRWRPSPTRPSHLPPRKASTRAPGLTDEVEAAAWRYIDKIDELGGSVPAIEAGFLQDEIERASYEWTKAVDDGSKVIVSVNRFVEDESLPTEIFPIDPALERNQAKRLAELRARRDDPGVKAALEDVRSAARGTQNLLVPMREALKRLATLGEVSDVLREEFGDYRPSR